MHLTRYASLHRLDSERSLLVNGLSGAVDLIDQELRSKLLRLELGDGLSLGTEELAALQERDYLFSSRKEEQALLKEVSHAACRLSATRPFQFVVCPTYRCNLACSYCFESSQQRARSEVMTREQVRDLFDVFPRLAARHPEKPQQLVLFGGEPLLPGTYDVIGEILSRTRDSDLTVQIVTNGTNLSRFSPLLARYRDILKGAQVTLDGPQPIHDTRRKGANGRGSFDEIVSGIEACLSLGIEINLRVNLDSHNLPHLETLIGFLENKGWLGRKGFQCQLAPVTDHLGTSPYPYRMREDNLVVPILELWRRWPELRKTVDFRLFRVLNHLVSVIEDPAPGCRTIPRFHYCEADGGDILTFGPDGLIYVCPESAGDSKHAVGSYSPDFRVHRRKISRWQRRSILTLPECRDCTIATFCGGGCAYASLARFGSPHHGICAETPQVLRAYLRSLGKRCLLPNQEAVEACASGE